MKQNRGKKIILTILIAIFVLFVINSTDVFAAINTPYSQLDGVDDSNLETSFNESSILGLLARLLYAVGQFLEWITGTIFQLLTGSNDFPWADKIVFNAVPLLDVNFINPDSNSFVGVTAVKEVLKNIYSTILSLAVSFFGITVLITAIKLVITTIASEKAKYKQAIVDWLVGFLMLFCMHYFISFVFYLNEELVKVASNMVTEELNKKEVIAQVQLSEHSEELIKSFPEDQQQFLRDRQRILNKYIDFSSEDTHKGLHEFLMKEDKPFSVDKAIDDNLQRTALYKLMQWATDPNTIKASEIRSLKDKELYAVLDIDTKALATLVSVLNLTGAAKLSQALTADAASKIFGSYENHLVFGTKPESISNKWFFRTKNLNNLQPAFKNQDFIYKYTGTSTTAYLSNGGEKLMVNKNGLSSTGAKVYDVISSLKITYATDVGARFEWSQVLEELATLRALGEGFKASGNSSSGGGSNRIIADLASYFKYNAAEKEFRTTDITGLKETGNINIQNMIMYAILVAQSLILFIAYIKRLFYVIILGMLAPMVVVIDFFKKFGK